MDRFIQRNAAFQMEEAHLLSRSVGLGPFLATGPFLEMNQSTEAGSEKQSPELLFGVGGVAPQSLCTSLGEM